MRLEDAFRSPVPVKGVVAQVVKQIQISKRRIKASTTSLQWAHLLYHCGYNNMLLDAPPASNAIATYELH